MPATTTTTSNATETAERRAAAAEKKRLKEVRDSTFRYLAFVRNVNDDVSFIRLHAFLANKYGLAVTTVKVQISRMLFFFLI